MRFERSYLVNTEKPARWARLGNDTDELHYSHRPSRRGMSEGPPLRDTRITECPAISVNSLLIGKRGRWRRTL